MSEVNEILKKVTASIEEATGKFNAKAEDALKEAQKSGRLSEETKAAVDKMASEFNALREAEKTLKAAMGELEQHVAQMPLANAKQVIESVGHQVISAEALKTFASSVEGGTLTIRTRYCSMMMLRQPCYCLSVTGMQTGNPCPSGKPLQRSRLQLKPCFSHTEFTGCRRCYAGRKTERQGGNSEHHNIA